MENKGENSKKQNRNSKENNKEKLIKSKLFIIVVIVILAIFVAIIATIIGKLGKDKNNVQNGDGTNQNANNDNTVGLIDMSKKDNVEIKQGVKENNSKALKADKTFEGMTIKDISLTASSGLTNFTATVENKTGKDVKGRKIVILFKNQDGSEFAKLNGILTDVKNNGTTVIDASTTADLANAYDFVIQNK